MTTSPSSAATRGRPSDLWTGLALLLIAAAMAGGALQFPLRGTYAGVKNAWYVSPALFPLIVATCLCLLAVTLIVTTVRSGVLADRGSLASALAGQGDVVLIAGIIAAFVVGLVPRVDFVVAGFFFLLAFTLAFHVHEPRVAKLALGAFFATTLVLLVMAGLGLTPVVRTAAASLVDLAVLLVAVGTFVAARAMTTDATARHRMGQCLAVALATPLLLGITFKFFLLVPLPREGLVVVALETVYYAIRGAL
ncbi:MAG TPA: hypothetical protein P5558_16960 [Geminicoccaceae bacterium]|nr:hypothetical protein [Geminicoccaceae bacterium]